MNISENSRVWIYQSDRPFKENEEEELRLQLETFVSQWHTHGQSLAAKAEIKYHRFIILIVDEAQVGASGCSIDKSVRFMKEIEQQYDVNLFDRFNMAYREGDEVLSCSRAEFEKQVEEGRVNENTIVFNNLVPTLADLKNNWEIPFKNSWHARVFGSAVSGKLRS